MTGGRYPDHAAARSVWLVTLADLALLLVGFLVMVHTTQVAPDALARAMRVRFGAADAPIAVAAQQVGFRTGSAHATIPDDLLIWAREAARDPRVSLTVAGSVDGSAQDVDPATGSGAILAADRARVVAAAIAEAAPGLRLDITAERTGHRAAFVTAAFTGPKDH